MSMVKIIKTEQEYEAALETVEALWCAEEGSSEYETLELWSVLIEKYEEENLPIDLPDPIEAIKFRMEQSGLTRKDLAKYIGSMSKVSEVLNYKRDLSLNMIRALHEGLGISAEVLLQKPGANLPNKKYHIGDYPFTEMFKRGYFDFTGKLTKAKEIGEELLDKFFSLSETQDLQICCRQGDNGIGNEKVLKAWHSQVLNTVSSEELVKFEFKNLTDSFIERTVKLSYFDHGPTLVKEALNKVGIHFVILEHLPKTHLDGACFFSSDGNPVVAMTLRHDRLDNFWFTLLHELGHLVKDHISATDKTVLMDDTSKSRVEKNEQEDEADEFARNAFISQELWKSYEDNLLSVESDEELIRIAEELEISSAVLAGRVRWETKNWTMFTKLLGHGVVKSALMNLSYRAR